MKDNFLLPKRDVAATKALRANRFFTSSESYITLPDDEGICHFVFGGPDVGRVREIVVARAKGRCQAEQHAKDCFGLLSFGLPEMDHIRGGDSGRCWCLMHGRKRGNLRMVNRCCHDLKHNRLPKFGPSLAGESV